MWGTLHLLALQFVLACVVCTLDNVYEAKPPCATRLRRTQRAVHRVLTRARPVSRTLPRAKLEDIRTLRHPNHWKGVDNFAEEVLGISHKVADIQLEVHIFFAGVARVAAVDVRVHRPSISGAVLLAADGAMEVRPHGDTFD